MRSALLPALLAAGIAAAPSLAVAQEPLQPRIQVTGRGEATIAPDMAIITLTVMREGETARAALDEANSAMARVIAAMRGAGLESRDLQTSGLMINPRYVYPTENDRHRQPRIVGYEVANTLTVRVRDIDMVGELLDLSVTLGVNQGGGISFVNRDTTAALERARRSAVADALARADTLADAAGVTLGHVLEISEMSHRHEPPRPIAQAAMRMEAADASVPVEAGENLYTVEVNVTFSIAR